jgi:hypothetical protein
VQVRADAVIAENAKADSIALEVTEERFEALTDYDLHDTIRAIAPSRGIDETAVIVALYFKEDGERVRVGIDVNTPRQDWLIKLDEGAKSTRRSVGVRNRMPQGQLVPVPIFAQGILDSGSPMYAFLKLTDRANLIIEALVTLSFRQFLAPATAASSGGGSTSGSSSASSSGSSSASSSANTALGMTMSSNEQVFGDSGSASAGTAHTHTNGTYELVTGPFVVDIAQHSHTIAHDHGIAHTHTTPDHTHGLTYGTFEEAMPASHSVTLRVYERVGSTWTLRGTFSGLTDDLVDVDLTAVMVSSGDWRLTVQSEAAQPNGGRLGCDLYGLVWVNVQSE